MTAWNFELNSGGNTAVCATQEGLRISRVRQKLAKYFGTDATLEVHWEVEGKKRPRRAVMIPVRFINRHVIQFKCGTQLPLSCILEVV